MRNGLIRAIATAVCAGLLASCAPTATDAGSVGSADAELRALAEESADELGGDPVKIGLLGPLSGPVAVLGKEMPAGAYLGAAWINSHGGIHGRPVEIVPIDTQADPEVAVSAVRKLADQGVSLYTGTISSSEALAVMDEVQRQNGLFMAAGPHDMGITHADFSEHTFRVTDNAHMRQYAEARYIAKHYPHISDWGAIFPNNALGETGMAAFESGMREFADASSELVAGMYAPFGVADYRNTVSQAAAKQPQVLMSAVYGGDAVTMYQQGLSSRLFDGLEVFVDNANEWQVARALKDRMPTVVQAFHWAPQAFNNEISSYLADNYQKYVGDLPSGFSSEPFSGVLALAEGLRKAGSGGATVDELIQALKGLTFDSPTGERTLRAEDHQAIKDVVFGVISADPSSARGWKVSDMEVIHGDEVIEEPNPGCSAGD